MRPVALTQKVRRRIKKSWAGDRFNMKQNWEQKMYRFSDEGTINGVRYVTVLDAGLNPVEYNIEYNQAVATYGAEEL